MRKSNKAEEQSLVSEFFALLVLMLIIGICAIIGMGALIALHKAPLPTLFGLACVAFYAIRK